MEGLYVFSQMTHIVGPHLMPNGTSLCLCTINDSLYLILFLNYGKTFLGKLGPLWRLSGFA